MLARPVNRAKSPLQTAQEPRGSLEGGGGQGRGDNGGAPGIEPLSIKDNLESGLG